MNWGRILSGAIATAVLTMAVAATPVQAQEKSSETGSRFSRDKYDSRREARRTLKYYGTCIAGYKSDKIEAFLLNPTQETWDTVHYAPNNQTRCAMNSMSSGATEYFGTVSEGWYLRRFKDGPPQAFTTGEQSPPPQEDALKRMEGLEGADLHAVVTEEFSRCVAATAPVQIDALLRTDVETREERAAIAKIVPYLGPCSFEGQNLSLDYESLRAMLAYALARRAVRLGNEQS